MIRGQLKLSIRHNAVWVGRWAGSLLNVVVLMWGLGGGHMGRQASGHDRPLVSAHDLVSLSETLGLILSRFSNSGLLCRNPLVLLLFRFAPENCTEP